jgi:hypothetical protein
LPTSGHATLTFHPMGEEDIHLKFTAAGGSVHVRGPPLSLTYKRGLTMLTGAPDVMYHKPEAYLSRYHKIVEVLEKVKPDLFVVDLLLHSLGVDAVAKTGVPYVVVSPGPSMDLACPNQPGGREFCARRQWLLLVLRYASANVFSSSVDLAAPMNGVPSYVK